MTREASREGVLTEADARSDFVTPQLIEASWSSAPHAIGKQRAFTNCRIKAKHTALRQANTASLSATLERQFAQLA